MTQRGSLESGDIVEVEEGGRVTEKVVSDVGKAVSFTDGTCWLNEEMSGKMTVLKRRRKAWENLHLAWRVGQIVNDIRASVMCLLDVVEHDPKEMTDANREEISLSNFLVFRLVLALQEAEDTPFESEDEVYEYLDTGPFARGIHNGHRVGVNLERAMELVRRLTNEEE